MSVIVLLCTKCQRDKPLSEFALAPGRPRPARHNRHSWCRSCTRDANRISTARRRALGLDRDAALRRNFGITLDDWQRLYDAQGGGCAICGRPDGDDTGRKLHTDHCHTNGHVRGLLCHACNVAIGHFDDDPARLRAAADYIERNQSCPAPTSTSSPSMQRTTDDRRTA